MTRENNKENIRVLIGEDSQFIGRVVADHLNSDPSIEVVGVARDGQEVLKRVASLRPDCVTLDLDMPKMNGLETLRYIMSEWPTPVVILSACGERAAMKALTCLEYGAVDFVEKTGGGMAFPAEELLQKVKMAAGVDVQKVRFLPPHYNKFNTKRRRGKDEKLETVVVIGASTGGPQALMEIIPDLPADLEAGVIIVQHMPAGFTCYMAERLNERSKLEVKEAVSGDEILPGRVLVAPGGHHLFYEEIERKPSITLLPRNDTQRTACPSIDFAFSSIAPFLRNRTVGVILTGMGRDGVSGSSVIRKFGGKIIVQDPETCIVRGMPGAVVKEKLQDAVVSIDGMSRAISDEVRAIVMESSVNGR